MTRLLAQISISLFRRIIAVFVAVALTVVLFDFALSADEVSLWLRGVMLGCSLLFLMLAWALYKNSSKSLLLYEDMLREDGGEILCRLDEIEAVDRGFFAMKPTNGFVLKLKDKSQTRWKPGLWWRYNKRIGIGGVASGASCKTMADIISLKLVEDRRED